jgi:hypothetical protein
MAQRRGRLRPQPAPPSPQRTYRPRRYLPVPYGLLFVGFVDRPRLFAFCRTAPGVRFRCSPTTRVGVLDFS